MLEDRRINRTKDKIIEAFFKCLRINDFEKVSVKAICEIANINRSTFYHHYEDIFDLYNYIETNLINQLHTAVAEYETKTIPDEIFFNRLLTAVVEHEEEWMVLTRINPRSLIESSVILTRDKTESGMSGKDYILLFFFAGFMAVISEWISKGKKESSTELAMLLKSVFKL